jgi:hypothetical protein
VVTVIVFDGATCAVDSGAVAGTTTHSIKKWWVHRNQLITGAGLASHVVALAEWYIDGATLDKFPPAVLYHRDAELVVIDPNGVRRYEASPFAIDHGITKCAFGEGRDFAYGALAMGATAAQAAEVACIFSPVCAEPIHTFIWDKGEVHHVAG